MPRVTDSVEKRPGLDTFYRRLQYLDKRAHGLLQVEQRFDLHQRRFQLRIRVPQQPGSVLQLGTCLGATPIGFFVGTLPLMSLLFQVTFDLFTTCDKKRR